MTNLVNWPTYNDLNWRDSGEGGLFAYAVWDTVKADCMVDVHPTMGAGDVLVQANGPLRRAFDDQYNDYSMDRDYTDYRAHWARHLVTAGTVVFLGSTGGSFYSDAQGEYFNVDYVDLTAEGVRIIDTLNAVYGQKATFVTFLDT